MPTEKKELGKKGEQLALRYLKKNGYRLIQTNYVCKLGEMDIIAQEKDTLAFVEVKTGFHDVWPASTRRQLGQASAALQGGVKLPEGKEARRRQSEVRCGGDPPGTKGRRDRTH